MPLTTFPSIKAIEAFVFDCTAYSDSVCDCYRRNMKVLCTLSSCINHWFPFAPISHHFRCFNDELVKWISFFDSSLCVCVCQIESRFSMSVCFFILISIFSALSYVRKKEIYGKKRKYDRESFLMSTDFHWEIEIQERERASYLVWNTMRMCLNRFKNNNVNDEMANRTHTYSPFSWVRFRFSFVFSVIVTLGFQQIIDSVLIQAFKGFKMLLSFVTNDWTHDLLTGLVRLMAFTTHLTMIPSFRFFFTWKPH